MMTRVPRTSSTDFFDDEDAFDGAFDFAAALENHLADRDSSRDVAALAGDDATWIDAPVAMVAEGDEPETVDLEAVDVSFEVTDGPMESAEEPIEAKVPVAAPAPVQRANATKAGDDPFEEWLQALVRAAESASIFVHVEALRAFVNEGRTPYAAFPTSAAGAVTDGNIGRLDGDELVASASFLRIAAEWRHVLAGRGGDFSKCGARTFDEWSADFLSRMLGAPTKFEWLKRELRRHGVAAFGLVEDAA